MDDKELEAAIFTKDWEGRWEPKRLRLTNGQTYDVARPGAIAIGRRVSTVVVEGRAHQVANLHIAQVEPLEPASAS